MNWSYQVPIFINEAANVAIQAINALNDITASEHYEKNEQLELN
jgi:hypothetical protein